MNKGWQNQWMKNKRDRYNRPNKTRSFVDPMFLSILTPKSLMHRFQDPVVVKLETSESIYIYIFICVWNTIYHYYPFTIKTDSCGHSYSVITVIFTFIFLLLRLTKRGACCCCCCCCTLLVKAFVGLLGYIYVYILVESSVFWQYYRVEAS